MKNNTVLRFIFEKSAHFVGYKFIPKETMFNLFGTSKKPTNNEELSIAIAKTLNNLTKLSEEINPTYSENVFMKSLIDIKTAIDKLNAKDKNIYLSKKTLQNLQQHQSNFLSSALILSLPEVNHQLDQKGVLRPVAITPKQTINQLNNILLAKNIESFNKKLDLFFDTIEIKPEEDFFSSNETIHQPRTWTASLKNSSNKPVNSEKSSRPKFLGGVPRQDR